VSSAVLRRITQAHLYATSPLHSICIGPASAAITAGFLQVVVSKARKHAALVHSPCFIALPIQHLDFPISMIPNGVSVLSSGARVHAMHKDEVGLIEGKESGSLLIRQCTSGRSLRSTFLSLRFVPRLDGMRVDDCPN